MMCRYTVSLANMLKVSAYKHVSQFLSSYQVFLQGLCMSLRSSGLHGHKNTQATFLILFLSLKYFILRIVFMDMCLIFCFQPRQIFIHFSQMFFSFHKSSIGYDMEKAKMSGMTHYSLLERSPEVLLCIYTNLSQFFQLNKGDVEMAANMQPHSWLLLSGQKKTKLMKEF